MIPALLQLLIILLVIFGVWWLLNRHVSPLHRFLGIAINVVIAIIVCVILLHAVGVNTGFNVGTPRLFR